MNYRQTIEIVNKNLSILKEIRDSLQDKEELSPHKLFQMSLKFPFSDTFWEITNKEKSRDLAVSHLRFATLTAYLSRTRVDGPGLASLHLALDKTCQDGNLSPGEAPSAHGTLAAHFPALNIEEK